MPTRALPPDDPAAAPVSRAGGRPAPIVSGLFRYPLKGGRAVPAHEVPLDDFGPAGDRRWMVVDAEGNLLTQRQIARLCQISAVPVAEGLRLDAPGVAGLVVPLAPETQHFVRVRVWNDRCDALDQGSAAAAWLRRWLGVACRLVYMPDATERRTDPAFDPIGARVSFADGYPILVAGLASLEALNERLQTPIPMNRFRPNVVISGSEPFEEDEWRRFRIGALRFDAVKPCARCPVPTIDQDTAVSGREPLRTLATFRRHAAGVLFGMNVVHRDRGIVRVGDAVRVEERGPGPFPSD